MIVKGLEMTIRPSTPAHRSCIMMALTKASDIQVRKKEMVHGSVQADWWKPPALPSTLVISLGRLCHAVCFQGHGMLVPGDKAGREGFGVCTTHCPPHPPQSYVIKLRLWGPRIRLLASRCQRDTFLFALPPRLPCLSFPRWGWRVTGAVLK